MSWMMLGVVSLMVPLVVLEVLGVVLNMVLWVVLSVVLWLEPPFLMWVPSVMVAVMGMVVVEAVEFTNGININFPQSVDELIHFLW